jgi:hypothetical protein
MRPVQIFRMSKKHRPPAPAPASPAAARPDALDWLLRLAGAVVFVVGVITLASPWLHQAERPPPPGWICWRVERATSAGSQRQAQCEPAAGWHVETWPGAGRVAVPDRAMAERRYPVRD